MITSLYAGLLGLLYFKISMDTILARRSNQISVGSGANGEILNIVSAHANFSSYAFFLLLQTYLAEQSGLFPYFVIHTVALSFTLGRIFHYRAFVAEKMDFKQRVLGMQLTLWPIIILSVMNIYAYISFYLGSI